MKKPPRRFGVYLVNLDGGVGSKIKKTRPCVVTSSDAHNAKGRTVAVVPMTTGGRNRPDNLKVKTRFQGKNGNMILDQSRYIDKSRILKDLGDISKDEQQRLIRASRKHNL